MFNRVKIGLMWLGLMLSVGQAATAPELELTDEQNRRIGHALVMRTDVDGQVNGLINTVTIKQTFVNPSEKWVHGRYTFPMPTNAVVDDLTFIVNGRKIKAKLKPREQAKQDFIKAKRAGKKAALMSQQRPNLFTMDVANIPPNGQVEAEIRYVDLVEVVNGRFELTLPTTLTPRYIPGKSQNWVNDTKSKENAINKLENPVSSPNEHTVKGVEEVVEKSPKMASPQLWQNGWAKGTDQVPDANAITPPQTRHVPAGSHRFSLSLRLDVGLPIMNLNSLTHTISSSLTGVVSVDNARMDRDFVLTWQPQASSMPMAGSFQQEVDGEYFALLMLIPPSYELSQSMPRTLTFIVDSSGSMGGESMRQAKQGLVKALSTLTPQDRFNMIDFDSEARALFPVAREYDVHTHDEAMRFIDDLVADGGTEMAGALNMAFDQIEAEDNSLQQIVFLTDGSVGNEAALAKLVNTRLGNARLFSVGIGSAPNRYFMQKIAKFGRGNYTFINHSHEVTDKIDTLMRKIQSPALTNIEVEWQVGGQSMGKIEASQYIEQFPERVPDVYFGEPILLVTKSTMPLSDVSVTGNILGQTWSKTLSLTAANPADNLDSLWARRNIANLMDQMHLGLIGKDKARDRVTELSLKHHVMSKFTSFIAIEEAVSRPAGATQAHRSVNNLMPKGNTMPIPQTATNRQLLMLLGVLGMLIWRVMGGSVWRGVR